MGGGVSGSLYFPVCVRKSPPSLCTIASSGASLSNPGSSSFMERGSNSAPERQCCPASRAFSSTQIFSLLNSAPGWASSDDHYIGRHLRMVDVGKRLTEDQSHDGIAEKLENLLYDGRSRL